MPAYRIETERLVLRCWQPEDLPMLQKAMRRSVDHLRAWMAWAHDEPKPDEEKIEFIRQCRANFDADKDYTYGIFNADETEVIGGTGLHTRRGEGIREIGYWIDVHHTSEGFATEATAALTQVAFEADAVHRVEIRCAPGNRASAAIPEKLGFKHEGTLRKTGVSAEGEPRDTMVWGLIDANYPDSPAYEAVVDAFGPRGESLISSGGREPG